jgi:hypothetical protein
MEPSTNIGYCQRSPLKIESRLLFYCLANILSQCAHYLEVLLALYHICSIAVIITTTLYDIVPAQCVKNNNKEGCTRMITWGHSMGCELAICSSEGSKAM